MFQFLRVTIIGIVKTCISFGSKIILYISARFFNAEDGSILSFSNKNIVGSELNQDDDLYYEVQTDMTNHSYVIYEYNGSTGSRKGLRTTPINFYEIPE